MSMIGYLAPVSAVTCAAIATQRKTIDEVFTALCSEDAERRAVDDEVCVEKFWHALHFIFSRGLVWESAGDLGELFMGGENGEVDIGYGPPRFHTPSEVAAFAVELATLSDDALRARFDLDAMAEGDVYPSIWDEDADALWEETMSYLAPVRALIATSAARGDGLMVWLS